MQRGQLEQGLGHLREARLRDPANQEIRYHLGSALVKAGREGEARTELDVALGSGGSFDGIEDARRLAAEIRRQ